MQLKLLWELQEIDLSLESIRSQIEEAPEVAGVQAAGEQLAALEDDFARGEENLKTERRKMKQQELKVQKIVEDRKELSDDMYGGKISNVKELGQMQRRMELLAEEKNKLEDEILNMMESVETGEAYLEEVKRDLEKNKMDLAGKEERLNEELNRLKQEQERLEVFRQKLVEKIDHKFYDRYRNLAEKHRGRALAGVSEGICSGCRVFISSAQRGHLYNPNAMVYCENCGRLLVNLEGS